MATKKEETTNSSATAPVTGSTEGKSRQGQSIVITDKNTKKEMKRADFIRDEYYKKGITRSDIRKALIETFNHEVPYQIVFAATKTGERGVTTSDPRLAVKAPKAAATTEAPKTTA